MSGLGNEVRRRGVVAVFSVHGVGDRRNSPTRISADQLKRIDAAVAEAIAEMEIVRRPKRRQVAVDANFGIPHAFARLGWRVDDGIDERIGRAQSNGRRGVLRHTNQRDLGHVKGLYPVAVAALHCCEEIVDDANDRSAIAGRTAVGSIRTCAPGGSQQHNDKGQAKQR